MASFKLIYDKDREEVIEGIKELKNYFKEKKVEIGISESIKNNTHFINIYCDNKNLNKKNVNMFNMYISNILYKILINEFFDKYINDFINDTYFFLSDDEINDIKYKSINILINHIPIIDEDNIYYTNRKNEMLKKITECIDENDEINIQGFMTFRMKEFKKELESIIDKVVENYMIEKEYNEFIKLLKYFVDIQESKMEEINIVIDRSGEYKVLNEYGEDIIDKLFSEFDESKNKVTGDINKDDILISALITYCPEKIVIHCWDNCSNKEMINTIKNVFLQRVILCDNCKICKSIKQKVKK
ncbi:putative sporulation protein YtxC [Clostridium rectalis]|uniref:putative sporulation protein YtxC n=1 Tax=Clostridium rectalis TaxID=2040295 RepID=UPI000F62C4BF|nr:putative sporulation protein YtxC [Clostridium rectalis]